MATAGREKVTLKHWVSQLFQSNDFASGSIVTAGRHRHCERRPINAHRWIKITQWRLPGCVSVRGKYRWITVESRRNQNLAEHPVDVRLASLGDCKMQSGLDHSAES